MKASLRALLTGAIDYAGLFPPAKLPLEEAVRNYARYRTEPESWMLGMFICPVSKLVELPPLMERFASDGTWVVVSALGRGGKDVRDYLDGLRSDFQEIGSTTSVVNGGFETRLPQDLTDVQALTEIMIATAEHVRQQLPGVFNCYLEVPFGNHWRESIYAAGQAAVRTWELLQGRVEPCGIGLKFRCGGLEPSAFPTPEQLAFALRTARELGGVLVKFTAGLHHPLRHFNAEVQTRMHGFLNVMGAAVLNYVGRLDEQQVCEVLADECAENFTFTDEEMRWKHITASLDEIRVARQPSIGSFGSCSFDEPRDDLRALGLL